MKLKRLLMPLLFTVGLLTTSCSSFKFDKYIDVVVRNISNPTAEESSWVYEEVYHSKVNIYNSVILPQNEVKVPNKQFLGYGVKEFEKGVSKKKDFYPSKGLVRYNDVKQYAVNGVVTLTATYVAPEDYPTQYIVFGWYGKTNTSGLDRDIMEQFETKLRNYIDSISETKIDPEEIEVREYLGDVATIGGNIMIDGDVDIFLGAGANLKSQGGVEYVTRNFIPIKGVTDRYIYKLNERESTNAIYSWAKSKEVTDFFAGK